MWNISSGALSTPYRSTYNVPSSRSLQRNAMRAASGDERGSSGTSPATAAM